MAAVPSLLQIRSPATEGDNGQWPPLVRKNTSGSSRLSQLFPSRPTSDLPASPETATGASRRTSFPSPSVSVTNSQRIAGGPVPPPLPTFRENTVYEPSASQFKYRDRSALEKSGSDTKNIFGRLASLHGTNYERGSYKRLHDEEAVTTRRLGDLRKERGSNLKSLNTAGIVEEERSLNEAGYAAEYERLESQLGAGMSSITERPFTHKAVPIAPGTYVRQPNSESTGSDANLQAHNAQEVAEKTGDIVAVAEIPVDISDSFGGGGFEMRSMVADSTGSGKNETQKSYFFPKGPLLYAKHWARGRANVLKIPICRHGALSQWVHHGSRCSLSSLLVWLDSRNTCVNGLCAKRMQTHQAG
jgi:hypothetical protein